jgi:DNA-binding transcriptional regulator YhcF (GntR family)
MNKNRPIYLQLMEELQNRIASGYYPPGGKVETVRELAADAAVNPNTMQRALSELEREGLLRAERTNGRFVTDDRARIASVRWELAQEKVNVLVRDLEKLGFHDAEKLYPQIMTLLREETEKEGGDGHE